MTESNGAALAVPALTDKQIRTRLEIAKHAGYGLEDATSAQLNVVYLLCQRYRLDPLTHVTLYRGRPWVTIDGRVELAKRHPEYRGFRTRPLSKEEKLAWDYRADDLVVECTITTRSWGEIASRGKVTQQERGKNTPAGTNPQEMAEKRAIARATRLAFGQSAYLDDDEAEQERGDPESVQRNADRYVEIFGEEDEQPRARVSPSKARAATAPAEVSPAPLPASALEEADDDMEERIKESEQKEVERQRKQEGLI